MEGIAARDQKAERRPLTDGSRPYPLLSAHWPAALSMKATQSSPRTSARVTTARI